MTDILDRLSSASTITPKYNRSSEGDVVSRNELINYAQREVADLRLLPAGWNGKNSRPIFPAIASLAVVVVKKVIFRDDLATPQISPSSDGGINIVWLVSGNRLEVRLEPDEVLVRGTSSTGRVEFEFCADLYDRNSDLAMFEVALKDAQLFLDGMSHGIRHRLVPR